MIDSTPDRPDADAATVWLIRRAGELPDARPAAGDLVFLHGDGVDAAVALTGRLGPGAPGTWRVCRTSWQRRYGDAPVPAPFRDATLVSLFQRLVRPGHLVCHGRGGNAAGRIVPGAGLVIDVAHAPGPGFDRRETLEIALAAAALERDAVVVFGPDGAAHLQGAEGRGWRQLVDHELLPLWIESCTPDQPPLAGVERVGGPAAARLRHEAAARLLL